LINELCDIFSREYEKKGDSLIVDSYTLSPGEYVEFTLDDTGDTVEIFKVDKKTDKSQDDYKKFAILDSMSKLISMNKPIDKGKIIHSNNMYAFYVKKDNLNQSKGKLKTKIIDGYYDILKNPKIKYKTNKKSLELYMDFEKKYGKPDGELVDKIMNWIKENIYKISNRLSQNKEYLKLFYHTDIKDYRKESQRYIIPNIYNKSDYNVKVKDKIYGLPDFNMGLNSKKPYLENKTRKSKLPILVDTDAISMQKKLFDCFMNYASEKKNYIYANNDINAIDFKGSRKDDFEGYFLRINKGKEVEIQDYDSITEYKYKLRSGIEILPIVGEKLDSKFKLSLGILNNLDEVKIRISEVFFNKYLENNFFSDAKKIKLDDGKVKQCLLKYRYGFYTWFYKGEDFLVNGFWNNMTLYLLCNSINRGNINRAANQFNLRHAVLYYFNKQNGGKNMYEVVKNIRKNIDEKINIKDDIEYKVEIADDGEYYFCIGQLLKYFYSLNKSGSKNYSFINPFLNAKSSEFIKERLRKLFIKYNYAIQASFRFNNMYYMVSSYNTENKIDQDLIIAGFLCPNLIYKKSDIENQNKEEN
jgi:CRISPR-associated protein Csh1